MEEKKFVQRLFQTYYSGHAPAPSRTASREFGFGFEKKIDFRHKSFSSEKELSDYLVREAPLFASYSCAYYEYPAARPMEKKQFLGSDLVFDLDAAFEHEGHNPLVCPHCLKLVKNDAIRLLEDFLLKDFGFSRKEVLVKFSGQKGYHLHLESESVQQLSQDGRGQLLDYVSGTKISVENLLEKEELSVEGKKAVRVMGPSSKSAGWKKKFYDSAVQLLSNDYEQLKALGLSPALSKKIAENRQILFDSLRRGNWGAVKGMESAWQLAFEDAVRKNAVTVDRSVTFDLARLIRLQDTLHGDTGLVAKQVHSLDSFDPLQDAVAFSKSKTFPVRIFDDVSFSFIGKDWSFKNGDTAEVPAAVGVFLLCKKKAALPKPQANQ